MHGIVINIDPVALRLGAIQINWYSIVILLAIFAAIGIAILEGKRKGISAESILSLAPWAIIGGLIGARLFHVVDHWDYYAANPVQIIMLQNGGLAIWGALAGGAVAVVIYARSGQIPLGRLLDILVPALLAAQIIGRFACIIDGDATGIATNLPWGFIYINPGAMVPADLFGIPTHPYPVYDQLWNLVGLALVLKLRRYLKIDGQLFLSYLSYYAVGRLVLTYVRHETIWFWGLQEAQAVAAAILIAAAGIWIYLSRRYNMRLARET